MLSSQGRFSIREMMIVILFLAAGLGGLSAGGLLTSVVIAMAAILTTGTAIVAFVGHHEMRAWAIGFLVPVIAYAATILSAGSAEFDPYAGRLPTTKLIQPLHRLIVKETWIDMSTGKAVPNYDPATDPGRSGGGLGAGGLAGAGTMMGVTETPDRTTFMSLAHVLLATMCGYVGSKFAVYVHHLAPRQARTGDEPSGPPESPVGRAGET